MTGQELANAAHEALRRGEQAQARKLFAEAARAESQAFSEVDVGKARTKAILAISATSLWYKAGDLNAAEQFAHRAFNIPNLPAFARAELRELLQAVWNEQAQRDAGLSFSSGQVLVSVKGGEVVTGGAPLDLILGKVQVVQNLFFRTVEYMADAPLRLRGPAAKAIQDRYRPWLFQSVPGSYQFAVAIQKTEQHDLFPEGEIEPEALTEKFLDIVRACSEDPVDGLQNVVTKADYRETFLKMTRSLAPSGKTFSAMEIRGAGEDVAPVVLSPESRKIISNTLRPLSAHAKPVDTEFGLRGNLRALDLDKDWLELAVADGETRRVSGLSEAVDDLIGPMVNHDVTVRVRRGHGRQLLFVDIEQED
ncbi:MAG: hypothetical protein KKB66_21615 [Alphaproteobacteria bacterium]|nr:hypothetical protein [Alphaproteobacteria bacterium]MBU0805790.1 hypothetical protein [Alphaproteobacteria bacterium]MBU0872527.1 hypothetical protein [Alphaproteobacteria bacterium]MBU1403022.1 hypothetical protein [Alphaproteobacteria bacterium]MBU1593783.1 hypothetical protein [Alphaproteobacteria bacterium]